jgi:hypothetical protein
LEQIAAANRLHDQLDQWRRSDRALEELKHRCPGFGPEATLLKVVTVNSLYGTNVYATLRMAQHVEQVMADPGVAQMGLELVERLANVPMGGGETKPIRRYSFASKFAHFFVDAERFPIFDSYAKKMVRFHLGGSGFAHNPRKPYLAFVENINRLVEMAGFTGTRRALDRYLWLAGQYMEWEKDHDAKINAECKMTFKKKSTDTRCLRFGKAV